MGGGVDMPIVDMPMEELVRYQGINPCPPDIDSFWDASVGEMQAINPRVELMPSKFQVPYAECFDLFFTGVGGARIHAKYLRPKAMNEPHPAVVHFHGYSVNSGGWAEKLGYVAMGFSIASLDCRGQGGLSQDVGGVMGTTLNGHIIRGLDDSPHNLLFRNIFLDAAQLAGIVMTMPDVDENRVGAFGGSQGGGLALACAALEPRVARAAVAFPFLCDYKRVWQMDLCVDAYAELNYYFRTFDPEHLRENDIFTKLGYIDVQHLSKRIRGEVRMYTGLMDKICPPSTQFAAYNKVISPKNIKIYPDLGHEWSYHIVDDIFRFLSAL
jgi:cephalosporin-C deacetylase